MSLGVTQLSSLLCQGPGLRSSRELDTGLACSGCSYIACIRLVDVMMGGWGRGACNAQKATYVVNLPGTLAFSEAYAAYLGLRLPKHVCQDADCESYTLKMGPG